MKLAASSAKQIRPSADTTSALPESISEFSNASHDFSSLIRVLFDDNVDSKAPKRTLKMDALLITSKPRITKHGKYDTDETTDLLVNDPAQQRHP